MVKHGVHREVRCGKHWIDYGNSKRGIEVDGAKYHVDKTADRVRDEYAKNRGIKLLHIPAADIYNNPQQVRRIVKKHIKSRR